MSDHPKEAERNLKRIRICNDIFFDVFHLLAPVKVGLELALVSHRFDALVDTHFKSRKWTLGNLEIYSENIVKRNDDDCSEETLLFPQKPLTNSIVGFHRVDIRSISSGDVIAFLRCIGRLFESNVCLVLNIYGDSNWNTFTTSVWPLLNVSAIIKIYFCSSDFYHFRRLISPSILRDCPNLRITTLYYVQSLQFPTDDSEGSSDGQALCKWLLIPRADGQPKVLVCHKGGYYFPVDALKTTFLNATTSVSFIIRLPSLPSFVPFQLINSRTRERLTIRQIESAYGYCQLIERSPIDKNAEQWAEWEREALEYGINDWKVLGIHL